MRDRSQDVIRALIQETTPDEGLIRLEYWPEGYILWYHGEAVWRSWRKAETVSKIVLKIDPSEVQAMIHAEMTKLEQRTARTNRPF